MNPMKDKIKEEIKKPVSFSKDRAASAEEMNKLKELIAEKIDVKKEEKKEEAVPQKNPSTSSGHSAIKVKEIPEDVLRKILE